MKVLFFGDSHTNIYVQIAANKIQNEIKFDTCFAYGATAQGAVNPNSKTKALNLYRETLERKRNNDYDYFGYKFGE